MAEPTWADEDWIKRRATMADQMWKQPVSGGKWSALEGLFSGLGSGIGNAGVHDALKQNQGIRRDTMQRAAQAPDNAGLSKILIDSDVPEMQSAGMQTLISERNNATARARAEVGLGLDELNLAMQTETRPMQKRQLQLQIEALEDKRAQDRWVFGEARAAHGGEASVPGGPASIPTGAAPPSLGLLPGRGADAGRQSGVPGIQLGGATMSAPAPAEAAAVRPAAPPAAPLQGYGLRQLLATRSKADVQAWIDLRQKDPAKASAMIMDWSNPNKKQDEAYQKEFGEGQAKAKLALPDIVRSAELMKRNIDALLKDKNLDNVVGVVRGHPWMPTVRQGSADAEARIKQIQGGAFMQAFQALKGGGTITEQEGAKATQSLARLQDTRISPKEFRAALQEFRQDVEDLVALAKMKAEGRGHEWKPPGDKTPDKMTDDEIKKALGL